ncbi:MAG: glycosyltransferase family 9 protein [Anaerohalosphaeraceae bacterium]|nr:glycosyltransferase family 9 protein [Anaerohalosphaeraceae bacterium]
MESKPEKILILKPSALGDVVMAMPAVCCLAENFPDAKISWFIRPEYSALVEEHQCVDNIIIFDRKKLGRWWRSFSVFGELVRLIITLRKEKFDIVFDFQGRFRSAIFAWFSGCKKRIGMKGTQEITRPFYTQAISPPENSMHITDYYLHMTSVTEAKVGKVEFKLKAAENSSDEIKSILKTHNIGKNDYAVFVPGSAVESKCWPVENFARLADEISEKYKFDIIATGVQSEKPIIEQLQTLTDINVVDFAGATNIAQLIALLAGAKIVVANDTGPAHIASALGVPMVLIFGQTNPGRVAPYARPETVAAIDAQNRDTQVESDNSQHDIKNVAVENVFKKICQQLDNAN